MSDELNRALDSMHSHWPEQANSIGLGQNNQDQPCIRVILKPGTTAEGLPEDVEGVPVIYVSSDRRIEPLS